MKEKMTTSKKKKKIKLLDLVMFFVLIGGIGSVAYPFISDTINQWLDQRVIANFQKKATQINQKEMKKKAQQEQAFNKELARLSGTIGEDPFKTKESKTLVAHRSLELEKHTLSILHIPKIKVNLPVFDQTSEFYLANGASLVKGTSYPRGGTSTHSVIAGHRGLIKAKLFSDLPKLKKKNRFYLQNGKTILAYEVDQLKVVKPDHTEDLHVEKGKDYVTLLTCTPYMVNSHRLLVRGHRIPYQKEMKKEIGNHVSTLLYKSGFLLFIFVVFFLLLFSYYKRHHK